MKLIIDISEEDYREILKDNSDGSPLENILSDAVREGTPLDNPTQMIDKSNFDPEQYKMDLDATYQCGYNTGYKNAMSVIDDIKADLWMEGMNMTGEYQGVWVRFRDIEKVMDKHIGKE